MGRRQTEDEVGTETARAAAAFEAYYQLGSKRSLRVLAETGITNQRQLEAWSSKFGWAQRVIDRQAEEHQAAHNAAKKEAALLARRRLRNAQLLQEAGITILARADLPGLDPDSGRKLVGDGARMIAAGMTAERLELGEATMVVRPAKPPEQMNDTELAEYIDLLERQAGDSV